MARRAHRLNEAEGCEMSTRIHRAMGYGMPIDRFKRLSLIGRDSVSNDSFSDMICDYFSALTDSDLTVPDDVYQRIFYSPKPNHPAIFETRLLATRFTNGGRVATDIGKSEDLFEIVMDCDELRHIIFFPNLYYRKKWCRCDDALDYEFEKWRNTGARGDQTEPRDIATYTEYGPYPFSNYLMLQDGTPIKWQHFNEVEKHPEWLPAVPSEIRWYLTKHNIMTENGVNQLRPIIAQWWC
jgi:hypothetical protein